MNRRDFFTALAAASAALGLGKAAAVAAPAPLTTGRIGSCITVDPTKVIRDLLKACDAVAVVRTGENSVEAEYLYKPDNPSGANINDLVAKSVPATSKIVSASVSTKLREGPDFDFLHLGQKSFVPLVPERRIRVRWITP